MRVRPRSKKGRRGEAWICEAATISIWDSVMRDEPEILRETTARMRKMTRNANWRKVPGKKK